MPTSIAHHNNTSERLGRLETTVEALHGELSEIRSSLRDIGNAVGKSKETNWSIVFSGAMLVGGIYAAAIAPLNADMQRQERSAGALAEAVVTRAQETVGLQAAAVELRVKVDSMSSRLKQLEDNGSPITDRRISIIETRLGLPPSAVAK